MNWTKALRLAAIVVTAAAPPMAPAPAAAHTVNAGVLNIRYGPGYGYRVIGSLSRGTVVNTTNVVGAWTRINSPKTGWVYSAYLSNTSHGGGGGGSSSAGFQYWMLNGRAGNVSAAVKAAIVRAVQAGLYVTSTTGGRHARGSYHYRGMAVDVAGSYSRMVAFYNAERQRGSSRFLELLGPGRWYIKYGAIRGGQFPGHTNHVHIAPRW